MKISFVNFIQQLKSLPGILSEIPIIERSTFIVQVGEVVTTIPTIGFNVEQVTYKNLKFQVWDLGGQTSIRQATFVCLKWMKRCSIKLIIIEGKLIVDLIILDPIGDATTQTQTQ